MKISRKFVSLLLVCVMVLCTVVTVSADKKFTDLSTDHWAYSYVQALVEDGTINGFPDESFRPEGTVTRAEFVKMIGKSNVAYTFEFTDVPTSHWGYDYIKYADMDVKGTAFRPDVAITRNDVLKLIWKRAGSDKTSVAPVVITKQSDNAYAAAWAYTYGIMKGDDGVNLRLSDGLTRAEATALICRSRALGNDSPKHNFVDSVNEKLIESVFDSFVLFDGDYSADRTFTNGEIAEATMRIATGRTFVNYESMPTGYSVDRKYGAAFYTACKYVWGEDKMTEAFYDATATNVDTLAALMFALSYNSADFLVDGKTTPLYDDVKTITSEEQKKYVAAALKNGIRLDNNNVINADSPVTAKNIALILLQMDAISPLNTNTTLTASQENAILVSLNTKIFEFPANYKDYQNVLKTIPYNVYSTPFVDVNGEKVTGKPRDSFATANDFSDIFVLYLRTIADATSNFGVNAKFNYYPSLVVKGSTGYILRVKVQILSVDGIKKFSDAFPCVEGIDFDLQPGDIFFADISTGSFMQGLQLPIAESKFVQVIK